MKLATACEPAKRTHALRPYQHDALERVEVLAQAGTKRILLVLPTGGGKTICAAHIIHRAVARQQRVLFLAHRRELIHQAYNRFLDVGLEEHELGILMASDPRRRPGAPVQIASIDTLRNRPKPLADVVFVDECHRALSKSYRDVEAQYPDALHLGLTATPFRADGKGLGHAYDELVVIATPRQLMDEGFLVEPRVFTLSSSKLPDLRGVRTRAGDYAENDLAEAVDRQSLVGNIVEHWKTHAEGMRTIAFAVSVAHSRNIVERFREAGIVAEHLDGNTPNSERAHILKRLNSGETSVVSNCNVLSEGFDEPSVKCAILARPTKSPGLYLQQAGRILRPFEGQGAIILDHAGCAIAHGLPQDTRTYSLDIEEGIPGEARKGKPPVRVCAMCFTVLPISARTCEQCGAELVRLPDEAEGQLVEATADDMRRLVWDELRREAAEKGYKAGWVYYQYRERFGEGPRKKYMKPAAPRAPRAPFDPRVDGVLRDAVAEKRSVSWSDLSQIV